MRERGGRIVLCTANAKMLGDALAKKFVYSRHVGLAIEFDEVVLLGLGFEFALNHRLIANERPVQIVGKRHVAARFPVADGLRFLKFAAESSFRADVEPKREMRTQRHGVESAEIVAIDSTHHAARDQREYVTIGENYSPGF